MDIEFYLVFSVSIGHIMSFYISVYLKIINEMDFLSFCYFVIYEIWCKDYSSPKEMLGNVSSFVFSKMVCVRMELLFLKHFYFKMIFFESLSFSKSFH